MKLPEKEGNKYVPIQFLSCAQDSKQTANVNQPLSEYFLSKADILKLSNMSGQNLLNAKQPPIQSTAGAVPVRNDKGKC